MRQHLHHLGKLEEAGQPDDLDRHLLSGQRFLERNEQPAGSAKHGQLRPQGFHPRVVQFADPAGDPPRLRPLVGETPDLHLALTAPGPGLELLLRVRPLILGDLLDDAVGRGQDPGPRPEVRIQGQPPGGGPVGLAELLLELEEVEQAGPPPAVDALIGIAHRRHREAVAEQPVDQRSLGHIGVLVFVQHHRRIAGAILLGRAREPFDDLQGERDLVSEVDDPEVSLQLAEPSDGSGQLDAFERCSMGAVAAVSGEGDEAFLVELDDPFGVHPVVGHLVGELKDLADQGGLPFGAHVLEHRAHVARRPATRSRGSSRSWVLRPPAGPGRRALGGSAGRGSPWPCW